MLAALKFPQIGELLEWKDILFKGSPFAVNKIVVLTVASSVLTLLFFFVAGSKNALVPRGIQGLAESVVDFVRDSIIQQTMGNDGMKYLTFLTSMFCLHAATLEPSLLPAQLMPRIGSIHPLQTFAGSPQLSDHALEELRVGVPRTDTADFLCRKERDRDVVEAFE